MMTSQRSGRGIRRSVASVLTARTVCSVKPIAARMGTLSLGGYCGLGRAPAEDERGGEAARVAAGGRSARVGAGGEEPLDRRALLVEDTRPVVDPQPADRVSDPGLDADGDARA